MPTGCDIYLFGDMLRLYTGFCHGAAPLSATVAARPETRSSSLRLMSPALSATSAPHLKKTGLRRLPRRALEPVLGLDVVAPLAAVDSLIGILGAVLDFLVRFVGSVLELCVAGLVLKKVLPWSLLDVPGPLGKPVGFLYYILAVYASFAEKFFDVVLDGWRFLTLSASPSESTLRPIGPSWAELSEDLERMAALRTTVPGLFSPSRDALRLVGDDTPETVRVVFWRDSAVWCPYCMKVQLFLEESNISYRVEWVNMQSYGDKRPEFLRISPAGLLPVCEIDGEVVRDSDRILKVLKRLGLARQGYDIMPDTGSLLLGEAEAAIDLVYQLQGSWMSWLRSPVSDAACRAAVESRLDAVEDVLARRPEGPFVLGKFSIVECHLAGILERVAASSAYFKGFFVRSTPSDRSAGQRWPRIQQWFSALEARPAFRSLCGDFFTHSHDLPPQLGTCAPNGKGAACADYIDGVPGCGAWLLPLPAEDPFEPLPLPLGLVEQDDGAAASEAAAQSARLEAAAAVMRNHDAVTSFALRALALPGLPSVRAELSDPNRGSGGGDDDRLLVDCALRHVVLHLLHGGGRAPPPDELPAALRQSGGERWRESLRYLQRRVGVPRDMSASAARQLRAHIGAVCGL
mmetsp:Transcript_64648/g.173815  ORF Transcript_64648/g.173815 Transcript_64648/m.173815 type:complete len:632 (-) Transcript_64648:77-1972(-)|eukprot:CAMPEP_0177523570 /NCGR_PEP_ID=MMETSP0369-20130122/49465_1 /TAXON_ID=447022 ORGANISM="Scrippsiella hangoei-like, Strain SHHI-4" /NCGR_SAMPLE_ID=MMETSP0369 /ASSEMBLY_ACC=CAM_ASM_000364 /LENGTH=631 /DNA_ID=CAMNT_0019003425 /DNA_START=19 /DNA_END=1914 /DNA_ORIENTATION=+